MLEMLRGKRLAFFGDSLNRNMWQSLACIVRHSLQDDRRVHQISGSQFKGEDTWAFIFTDYDCSIEFFQSEFLVEDVKAPNGDVIVNVRLDMIKSNAHRYQDADVVVFNTGHSFTHAKTNQGKGFYQEGNHLYSQLSKEESLSKAMRTWARWVDTHVNKSRTRIFFRAYSPSHFDARQWSNNSGSCDRETLPLTDDQLITAPKLVGVVESVIMEMRSPVVYLNVTRMTGYRKDAHPAKYRPAVTPPAESQAVLLPGENKQDSHPYLLGIRPIPALAENQATPPPARKQDCSQWCLPGVPDVWNEMLYAMLSKG